MLIVQDGDKVRVARLMRGIPADDKLIKDFGWALTSKDALAVYDRKTKAVGIGAGH